VTSIPICDIISTYLSKMEKKSVIPWPSFDNVHRSIVSKYPIDLNDDSLIATEKLDGSNGGVVVDLKERTIVSIQSRGQIIWPAAGKKLSDAKIGDSKFAGKDESTFVKIVSLALSLAEYYKIENNELIIYGEVYLNEFRPFGFSFQIVDKDSGNIRTAYMMMTLKLHSLIESNGLNPPRLLLDHPTNLGQLVSCIKADLTSGDRSFEGAFITHDNCQPTQYPKGYKLKSVLFDEQPACPFIMDDIDKSDVKRQEVGAALIEIMDLKYKFCSHKKEKVMPTAKVAPISVDTETLHQIELAYNSVMSKSVKSEAEISSLPGGEVSAIMKTVAQDVLKDLISQYDSSCLPSPDIKTIRPIVTKFVSSKFFKH
jgi:hypothetical protein